MSTSSAAKADQEDLHKLLPGYKAPDLHHMRQYSAYTDHPTPRPLVAFLCSNLSALKPSLPTPCMLYQLITPQGHQSLRLVGSVPIGDFGYLVIRVCNSVCRVLMVSRCQGPSCWLVWCPAQTASQLQLTWAAFPQYQARQMQQLLVQAVLSSSLICRVSEWDCRVQELSCVPLKPSLRLLVSFRNCLCQQARKYWQFVPEVLSEINPSAWPYPSVPICRKKHLAMSVEPQQVPWYAGAVGLQQPSGQFAAQGLNQYQQAALQAASQPTLSTSHPHQSSYGYPQAHGQAPAGNPAGQTASHGGPQGSAVLQVQAALADPARLSHPTMPAQQATRQHEASQGLHFSPGLTQQPGTVTSPAQGVHGAVPGASWQLPAGALIAAAGSQEAEGSTPAGDNSIPISHCFVQPLYALALQKFYPSAIICCRSASPCTVRAPFPLSFLQS